MAGGYIAISLSESGINTSNNTSVVTANVYYYGNGVSWSNYNCPGTIVLDGTSYSFTNTVSKSTSAQWIGSASKTITHNADGSRSVSCSASFTVTGTSLGTLHASNSLTLTTIPRATTPTLSAASIALGSAVTINTPRASSAFTHTLTYKIGSSSGTIGTGVTTSKSWTVTKSLANQIPGNTSGTVVITCNTYNGSTLIGTKTVNLTVTVPYTAEFKPKISSVSIAEAVEKVKTAFGLYAQSLSQLNVDVTAAGAYSSTIKSYSTVFDGVTYNAAKFTSNVINGFGTIPVKVTVTDSRGRTDTKTVNISVEEYAPPAITEIIYQQCNADGTPSNTGTSTKITVTGKASSVSGKNSKTLVLKWKKASDTNYQSRTLTASDWAFTVSTIVNNTGTDETYEFAATLTDKIMSVENGVQTGKTVVSCHAGGDGVTLFKEAENEGFWVGNIDYTITDAEYDEIQKLLGGGVLIRLIDWIYPVGHVITTVNPNYDPNKIFKTHTWVRFAAGRTLVGVNEGDTAFATAEKTGGEKTHKLTASEMPGHYHLLHDYGNSANVYTSTKSLASSESTSNPGYATTLTRYSSGYTKPSDTDTYRLRTTVVGSNTAHNNMPPYTTVYFWKRTK